MTTCQAIDIRGNLCGKPVTHMVTFWCLTHKRMEEGGVCDRHGIIARRVSRKFSQIRVRIVSDNGGAKVAG